MSNSASFICKIIFQPILTSPEYKNIFKDVIVLENEYIYTNVHKQICDLVIWKRFMVILDNVNKFFSYKNTSAKSIPHLSYKSNNYELSLQYYFCVF